MGLKKYISSFLKKEILEEPQLEKSKERLQQEQKLIEIKSFAERISNNGLNELINNLSNEMKQHPYYTFDERFNIIKNYINNNLTHKDYFLMLNNTYKFSKSNPELTKYFAETHYFNYDEKLGYASSKDGRLSVTADEKGILSCAIYGDQLTIFENNPDSKYFEQLKQSKIEYVGGQLSEYVSDFLIIKKNLSMSDPYVVKSLIKNSSYKALVNFFNPIIDLEKVYTDIGFTETAKFYHKAKELFDKGVINFKEELDNILPDKEKDKMLDKLIYELSQIDDNDKKEEIKEINKEETR